MNEVLDINNYIKCLQQHQVIQPRTEVFKEDDYYIDKTVRQKLKQSPYFGFDNSQFKQIQDTYLNEEKPIEIGQALMKKLAQQQQLENLMKPHMKLAFEE